MKNLSVCLNQDYLSFCSGFECTIEGDLIVISGVNGGGKSQFLDIISQRERNGNKNIILADINLNERQIHYNNVIRRSFKENINISEIRPSNLEIALDSKKITWNHYRTRLLDSNSRELRDYSQSSQIVKKILIDKFGEEKFNKKLISEEELRKSLPSDFIWEADDIFTNEIGKLFFGYLLKEQEAKAHSGENGVKFNPKDFPEPPWKQLNDLFLELGLDYRFKDNYCLINFQIDEQPCLYYIEDGSININKPRKLVDLSDGEKSIISLSFGLISDTESKDIKILLLDEFDASFNPSLTEVFYKVIKKYFISRGILVIIVTHSPATVSLAPADASFYEFFKYGASSCRILSVDRGDYNELHKANKLFYDKISDQKSRIEELENKHANFEKIKEGKDLALLVEDEYDAIYKIAWLKINDIKYDNNIEDINQKFKDNAKFEVFGGYAANGVAGFLRANNVAIHKDKKIVGLFDYDEEGVRNFYCLKKDKVWEASISGSINSGYYKKRNDHACFYALLLPVPNDLRKFVTDVKKSESFTSYIEIENLLSPDFLKSNNLITQKPILDLTVNEIKACKKKKIWKLLYDLKKEEFKNFIPIFDFIESKLD